VKNRGVRKAPFVVLIGAECRRPDGISFLTIRRRADAEEARAKAEMAEVYQGV